MFTINKFNKIYSNNITGINFNKYIKSYTLNMVINSYHVQC